uniref:Uncharacterized protein n=1 Tax=Arundo donax TaxID=35708 RepID=A0A0A8ZMR1_ARUDO
MRMALPMASVRCSQWPRAILNVNSSLSCLCTF